jgi:hypothetical protein
MLNSASLLVILATVGIQWGWEPGAGGGNTYIVQVEPELIDTFRDQGFSSDVPPELRDIRRIEIRVGSGALPHQGETAFKVPDKVTGDATKPPRLDAAPADSGDTRAPSDAAKATDDRGAAKQLPKTADAAPLHAASAKSAEQASFHTAEPSAAHRDGQSSASATSTTADSHSAPRDDATASQPARSPSETDPAESRDSANTPSIPLLSALGALIVSGAGNLYLGWVHLGTRRRYREVVGQLRETDLPIAIEPHNEP